MSAYLLATPRAFESATTRFFNTTVNASITPFISSGVTAGPVKPSTCCLNISLYSLNFFSQRPNLLDSWSAYSLYSVTAWYSFLAAAGSKLIMLSNIGSNDSPPFSCCASMYLRQSFSPFSSTVDSVVISSSTTCGWVLAPRYVSSSLVIISKLLVCLITDCSTSDNDTLPILVNVV